MKFFAKLKRLIHDLKVQTKLHFGDIFQRLKAAEDAIASQEILVENDPSQDNQIDWYIGRDVHPYAINLCPRASTTWKNMLVAKDIAEPHICVLPKKGHVSFCYDNWHGSGVYPQLEGEIYSYMPETISKSLVGGILQNLSKRNFCPATSEYRLLDDLES
ncbi:hypothetical protein ACH5RR_008615 [Cinchona calisaya]|uniref:Uncharacterized protein n=1 Tax=Cinchona calisaya TaxID=153742 RepID=A0ABD3AHH3_9GENT